MNVLSKKRVSRWWRERKKDGRVKAFLFKLSRDITRNLYSHLAIDFTQQHPWPA